VKDCCPITTASCRLCGDTGTVALAEPHPQAPGIDCPHCRAESYPDGFPGLAGLLPGSVLIPAS
jgi:hypothetical protein